MARFTERDYIDQLSLSLSLSTGDEIHLPNETNPTTQLKLTTGMAAANCLKLDRIADRIPRHRAGLCRRQLEASLQKTGVGDVKLRTTGMRLMMMSSGQGMGRSSRGIQEGPAATIKLLQQQQQQQ